jgi:hypothetical protein
MSTDAKDCHVENSFGVLARFVDRLRLDVTPLRLVKPS